MYSIALDRFTDFNVWRDAARQCLRAQIPPQEIFWHSPEQGNFLGNPTLPAARYDTLNVSPEFLDLAKTLILARTPDQFSLPYEILWTLQHQKHILADKTHPLMLRAHQIQKHIRRDMHKMRAFVRFKTVVKENKTYYIAWFEPDHYITLANAPFFMKRFANMHWSILTPDQCIHWDQENLSVTGGAARDAAPSADKLEAYWQTYYTHIFNPARVKIKAMTAEMPKKYWHNLPEADLIAQLIKDAETQTHAMMHAAPNPGNKWENMTVIDNQLRKKRAAADQPAS